MMTRRSVYTVVFMIVIAAVFGAGVTGIFLASRRTLRENESFLRERALVRAFGLGDPDALSPEQTAEIVSAQIDDSEVRRDPETGWEFRLLRAFADAGHTQLQACGFRFRGLGFWGPVEGILALSPDLENSVGLVILSHKETPGLGGRIEEPVFTDAFRDGLDLSPAPTGSKHIFIDAVVPQPGSPAFGRHVDAITGATQTSMAMERMLDDFIARFHRAMRGDAPDERGRD